MTRTTLAATAILIAACGLGGLVAAQLWLPLPWMLGALLVSGVAAYASQKRRLFPESYKFPEPFRNAFVALIGVMIGTQVSPDLVAQAALLPYSVGALVLFVCLVFWGNYHLFRRVGGYDAPTAFFSAAPGGLIDSIMLGESAGADLRRLTAQQFLRIIVVIVLLPLGISLWVGHPVGSASGMGGVAAGAPVPPGALAMIIGTAAIGYWLGRHLNLPASQILGPLILSASATLLLGLDLHLPFWLIALSQVIVGASLGLRFHGISGDMIRRAFGLALASVAFMMVLGAVIALLMHQVTGLRFDLLLISYAPGGVTEMSLVALSLSAAPALVTLHHVLRIFMTVVIMGIMARRLSLVPRPRPSRPG